MPQEHFLTLLVVHVQYASALDQSSLRLFLETERTRCLLRNDFAWLLVPVRYVLALDQLGRFLHLFWETALESATILLGHVCLFQRLIRLLGFALLLPQSENTRYGRGSAQERASAADCIRTE